MAEEGAAPLEEPTIPGGDMDLRNTILNGIIHLEDRNEGVWRPHFFVLTGNKLYYTDTFTGPPGTNSEEDPAEDGGETISSATGGNELHYSERWFHKLKGKRIEAETLLRRHAALGDGTFLVRESENFVGDYTLSFWRVGEVKHCRIHRRNSNYYLVDTALFESLLSLVAYYRQHPIKTPEFQVFFNLFIYNVFIII